MNILMISTFPPRRCGIGDYTADLVNELAQTDGIRIQVLTYSDGCSEESHPQNGLRVSRKLEKKTTLRQMGSLLGEFEADLVHLQVSSFLHHPSLVSALARTCDVPLVTTVHDAPRSWRIFYTIPSLRRLFRKSSRLITHSSGVSRTLSGFHGIEDNRIVQIPHGVDTDRYHPGTAVDESSEEFHLDDQRIVLFFGFVRPGKGIETLLRAWHGIESHYPKALLVIAGGTLSETRRYAFLLGDENGYPVRLMKLARKLDVAQRVLLTGYVPERLVPGLLNRADMVVLPYEGRTSQSGPLHKALSSGKPVIATRVPGFEEILADGENGMLVPEGDVDSLSQAISTLMEDPHLARKLGNAARQFAERHLSWSRVGRLTIGVYSDLVGS